jgi:hypothetical protein
MKKLCIGLLLAISFYCSAQEEVNVYWGKFNAEDRFSKTHLIGRRGDFLYSYKQTRKTISILKYSFSDLQVKSEHPIWGNVDKNQGGKTISRDYDFEEILKLKTKMYIVVSKYDKKSKLNSLYMQEINLAGELTGSLKKVSDVSAESRSNRGDFDVYASSDSNTFLLVNYPPYEKYSGEKFGFKILDEDLDQLSNSQVELPYKDKYFSVEDFILSNDGNIYMMAKIDLEKKDKQKGEAKSYYEVVQVNPQGTGQVTEYEIKLPEKYINAISFSLKEGKFIVCAGFYSNIKTSGASYDDINGVFFLRINKATKQIEATGTKDLDKDFVADLTSERKANKGRGISNDFVLRDFLRRSDGGSVILAEFSEDYVVVTTTSDKYGMHTQTDYHYIRNNIIAIDINPDGSIKWYANIPKYQHTVNDGGIYSSYMLLAKDDKMYIVYNDNPKNLDPNVVKTNADVKRMGSTKNSTAVLVELSESGEYTKKGLFDNKDNKVTIMPSSAIQISKNEEILPAYNAGFWCCISFSAAKSKLARLEFK